MKRPETQARRRLVLAPKPSHPALRPAVLSVECAEEEEVHWHWTETAAGRFVSGYEITPRPVGDKTR